MRFRTLEIRWHDSKPISSCDFQPVPAFKKARPPSGVGYDERWAAQSYRLATAGEDNHVRIWMVYPNIRPANAEASMASSSSLPAPHPPRVEYLATLSRHSAAVNVVRWSPNGELVASAGDDGMIIIWAPSNSPQTTTYGSDLSADELQNEKEYWRVRHMVRCTSMQVYDLAWSPSGEYIIAGSTDNCARIYQTSDGKCIHEIAEHSHYVQGVSWDPLNEYIATQSSDRSMHVYHISTPSSAGNKHGTFEAHAIGKNSNMTISSYRTGRRHARTPSTVSEGRSGTRAGSRPAMFRHESNASDAESVTSEYPKDDSSLLFSVGSSSAPGPPTPGASSTSTPSLTALNTSMFPPPPIDKEKQSSSRRSSFSGSNAPSSPAFSISSRYARSPSPMPALPAIRTAIASPTTFSEKKWKLYGDESYSNFFRRLSFSPDGGFLITPAGQFEDPEIIPQAPSKNFADGSTPSRGRKQRPSISTDVAPLTTTSGAHSNLGSCVYIYTRANFARPPVAQLPGYKKASVAVKFSPVLFDLRPGVAGAEPELQQEPKTATLEKGTEGAMDVDIFGPVPPPPDRTPMLTPVSQSQSQTGLPPLVAPAPRLPAELAFDLDDSPALSPMDLRPPTPAASKPSTPAPSFSNPRSYTPAQTPSSMPGPGTTSSMFLLPYRMLFAVVTMDTLAVYDTQQSTPICLLTKLHYDEFTDVTWSPDGQCLLLSSRDGYCTLVTFDEILPAYHTQQHSLQLQSIAHQHSVPLDYPPLTPQSVASQATPGGTPVFASVGLPLYGNTPSRRQPSSVDPPLTPAASVDGDLLPMLSRSQSATSSAEKRSRDEPEPNAEGSAPEPPKKKRRVVLTRIGDIGE
ncbi:WD40 repeat-like protein [Mycena floridula]|nr:WD40 repeat-like protein [Mycena floridula]